jgi:uncharacterized protein YbjT (DUF2867 family)
MATAAIFGSTGAVGSNILTTLLNDHAFTSITTFSRRLPKQTSPKLSTILEPDTSKWGPMISTLSRPPTVVFNAVGTTLFAAGSYAKQRAIDHDLCVANIQAAKAGGVKTYVYISVAGTRSAIARYWPYGRMKIGVEDALREADFECGIVLRPGMIIGDREESRSWVLEKVIGNLHWIVGRRVQI